MSNPTLGEDILYAISCIQDYRDTLDIDGELWHEVGDRIERLFKFYYQLIGFDPYEHQMNIAKKVMAEDSEALGKLSK